MSECYLDSLLLLSTSSAIVALHGVGFTSAYFDRDGYSLLNVAATAGCPAVAIDWPGSGPARLCQRAIARFVAAELIQCVIADFRRDRSFDAAGVVLVGHSIGSATALHLAALEQSDWLLLGIAYSGFVTTDVPRRSFSGNQKPTGVIAHECR